MNRILADLRAALQFLHTGLRQIDKNASLFPSSRYLVKAMLQDADIEHAKCVVEFGPGTGVITKEILARLPPDGHLHAIELDGDLLKTTTALLKDPRLHAHHGSAADATKLIRDSGCMLRTHAVISSLGLALMNDELRAAILARVSELLLPDGIFMQYTYPHAMALTYQFEQGWARYHAREFLSNHFRDVQSRMVWRNAPPAMVLTCRHIRVRPVSAPSRSTFGRHTFRRRRRAAMGKR